MPIPYPYFHLMNFIMLFNFFVIGFALATLKSWGTIIAFGFAEMIYMGLRKVSVDLSEPFEQAAADFPIASFMDYVFDHCVGLLEAFSHPLAYARLHKLVKKTHSFSEDELVASCLPAVKYDQANRVFIWGAERPLSLLHKDDVKKMLSHALVDPEDVKHSISSTSWTAEEIKAYAWKCHHCGKVFRPDCLDCKRCGTPRLKQQEQPKEHEEDAEEIPKKVHRMMTSALDLDRRGMAKKDGDPDEDRSASEESLRALAERRNEMESLRDKLGAARVRIAILKAGNAGVAPQAAGTFKSTLDAALALENAPALEPAPAEVEESDADTMSPVLARSAEAYNSRWAGQVGAQPANGKGMSPAMPFDQAQQQMRRNMAARSRAAAERAAAERAAAEEA